jgi:hypothetical protein
MANPLNQFADAYDPNVVADYIQRAAISRGMDPSVALSVAKSEGLRGYVGDKGSSFGPFQLHYGNVAGGGNKVGGLGDVFTRTTGLDARDPRTWRAQVDFALGEAQRGGWGPWHGWKGEKWAGIAGDHPSGQLYETGRFVPQEQPLAYGSRAAQLPPNMLSPQPLAYTQAPERPDFPSLKAPPQQVAQQFSPEDFFEGKHLEQTAPQQPSIQVTAPDVKTEYTPEDYFEGKHQQPGAAPMETVAEPSNMSTQGEVSAVPDTEWGAGRSFMRGAISGLTGGAGDLSKAGATVRAGYEALTGQAPEGFMARRKAITEQLENARRAYEQENPMISEIATGLGAATGTALPLGVAGKALGAGMRAAGTVAPRVAPALEYVGGFLGGKGTALKGIPSATAEGALYGMGESALTQKLVPEEDRGLSSILHGGLGGAVFGGTLGPVARTLGKSFEHAVPQERIDLVNMAKNKFDLDVHLGQVSSDPEVNKLYKEVVSPKKQMKQVDAWNKKVSEEIGLNGKSLTDENIQEGKRHWGTEIADSVKNKRAVADTKMFNDLFKYETDLFNGLPKADPLRAKFQEFTQELMSNMTATGELKGEILQGFLRHQGRIDRLFTNTNDPLFKKVGHDMRDIILDTLERSDPSAAKAFREARDKYKKLAAVDEIVAGSDVGKISPNTLKAAVRARKIGQDPTKPDPLKQLADIGAHLPELNLSGALRTANRPFSWRSAGETAAALAGPVASLAGFPVSYGNLVSFALMGDLVKRGAQSQIMGSNVLNRMAQSGFYQPAASAFENVLLGTGGAYGVGVGGMERER